MTNRVLGLLIVLFQLSGYVNASVYENGSSGKKSNRPVIYHVGLTESEAQETGLDEFDVTLKNFYRNKHAKRGSLVWPKRMWYAGANGVMGGIFFLQRDSATSLSQQIYQAGLSLSFANFALAPLVSSISEQAVEMSYNSNDPSYGKTKKLFDKLKHHANLSCQEYRGVGAKMDFKTGSIPVIRLTKKYLEHSNAEIYLDGKLNTDAIDKTVYAFSEPIICDMGNYLEPLNDLFVPKCCESN